jgi:GH43 family beta-xylosidase
MVPRWTRIAVAVLLPAVLIAGCTGKPKEIKPRAATYANPVYTGEKDNLPEAADPMAIKYNGEYYAYVTGDPCLVFKSPDLIGWTLAGPMTEGTANCWAPDVVYKNGIFYAYMAPEPPTGVRRIQLFTSTSPTGPFKYEADLTTTTSYDPHYFEDENGKAYLYWTEECDSGAYKHCTRGNSTVADELVDMKTRADRAAMVIEPEVGWECRYRCIVEAPSVLKRKGQYYTLYSGAAYENESYANGVARSTSPLAGWTKLERVLQSSGDDMKVHGPGGASWVKGPNNLDDWLIYHGRGITKGTFERWLRVDTVMWGQDRFWVPGGVATFTEQPGPALPAFQDRFDGDTRKELGKPWATSGGKWEVAGGVARQTDADAGAGAAGARALAGGDPAAQYAFEANLRWAPGTAGGAVGIYAYWADDKNYAIALLDRSTKALVVNQVVVGGTGQPASLPLSPDFNFDVYHQLIVRKNGPFLQFLLDGHPLGTMETPFTAPGKVGLATDQAAAEFDGVAFTHGWEDLFEHPVLTWAAAEDGTKPSGSWSVKEGLLTQSDTAGRHQTFKGTRQWGSYELAVTLQSAGKAGVYGAYYDAKNYLDVLIDPAAGALVSTAVVGGKAETQSAPLKDLDPTAFHALRIVKDGFQFSIYVDGKLVQQRTATLSKGQPGLITDGAAVSFDSVKAVRWD